MDVLGILEVLAGSVGVTNAYFFEIRSLSWSKIDLLYENYTLV